MKLSDAFPSKYISSDDLDEQRPTTLTISRVEKLPPDEKIDKPVCYFDEAQKGLLLNQTNFKRIAHSYGDDTKDWSGGVVELHREMTEFKGDYVPCVRVHIPRAAAPAPKVDVSQEATGEEIPF